MGAVPRVAAPSLTDFVLDTWAPLSHKAAIGDGSAASPASRLAPMWVGHHARRLSAYRIYQSYIDNASRHFVNSPDRDDRADHREYGDAKLLRNAILAALLGDRSEIVVDGAADYDAELDATPESPQSPLGSSQRPPNPPGVVTTLGPAPEGPTPEERADNAEAKSAADREEWLRDWADEENFAERMAEAEGCAVGLGDGIYVLAWDASEKRVCVVGDFRGNAGFYFPVRSARFNQRRPTRVHLASEVEIDAAGNVTETDTASTNGSRAKRFVHRITFELVDLPDGETRRYPWQGTDEAPSTKTCHMTEGYWPLSEARSSLDFTADAARYETTTDAQGNTVETRDLDLRIDFIPVVHIRNTPGDDWGESSLAPVVQVLDDLSYVDTDLARAAPVVGIPPLWSSGAGVTGGDQDTYGPGTWIKMTEGGSAGIIDTSNSLTALSELREGLRERISVNARVPQSVLGRLTGQAESGVHLALNFGPLSAMVGLMHLVRKPPYSDLFDMVQKLAMAGGSLDAGVPHHAEMVFGSYLPVNKTEVTAQVAGLLGAGAISRELALRLLTEAGFPIDDAQRELERIESSDFIGANALMDATDDQALVFDYLRRQPSAPSASPSFPSVGGAGLTPRLAGPQPAPTGGVGAQPAEPEQR